MSNPHSEEHVSIDRYGSEEIIDIIDHKRPTQGSAAPKEIFSLLVNEGNHDRNIWHKCLMNNSNSEEHV